MRLFEDLRTEAASRQRREEQYCQSQKMELVGRLTSGVAHDFNNLLTVILGYSEVLLQTNQEPATRSCVEEIKKAAERATALTTQLLSFSRKQPPTPRNLDLNSRVRDMEKMVRRLIGEEIVIVTRLDPDLAPICADPGQIEQVILNLAVNARDAMPDGGTLTLTTENVRAAELDPDAFPRAYVVLTVRDTGCGMDEPTLARIFEPFYTTKAAGKGTGLGLATIQHIVRQGGGHVRVSSRLGHGTTFRVYIPAAENPASETSNAEINSAWTHDNSEYPFGSNVEFAVAASDLF